MKILLNAASAHMGGAVTYLRHLVQSLLKVDPEVRLVVCVPAGTHRYLHGLTETRRLELLSYPYRRTDSFSRIYFDQVVIPRLVKEHAADVLFSSTGFGTFRSPCAQVLLIRNSLFFEQSPGTDRARLFLRLRRLWSIASIRAANVVLFPTSYMRDVVMLHTPLPEHHAVLHYGFDRESFFAEAPEIPLLADIRGWKAEGYRILLNVASYASHKNFETVIRALPRLEAAGLKVKFVTTLGRDDTGETEAYDRLIRLADSLGQQHAFVRAGYLPHSQLSGLYREADLFVFPSATESFGQPMVEAMASGVPVVAAATPVSREVCGAAGHFFETFDPEECALCIRDLLEDDRMLEAVSAAATERARDFSWLTYASSLLSLMRPLLLTGASTRAPRRSWIGRTAEN